MKSKIIFYPVLSTLLLFGACGKKANKHTNKVKATNSQASLNTNYLEFVHIKPGEKISLKPRIFIEIGILFNHEQKKWTKEVQAKQMKLNESISNTNAMTNASNFNYEIFLKKKREAFYKKFGLSESMIGSYNVKHYQEIEQYLNDHPDLKNAYENSGGTDLDQNIY